MKKKYSYCGAEGLQFVFAKDENEAEKMLKTTCGILKVNTKQIKEVEFKIYN